MTTFVLLHGAFHGGWCWPRVAGPLCAAGHTVFTPTQTGLGKRAHALSAGITLETFVQDLVAVLETEGCRTPSWSATASAASPSPVSPTARRIACAN